MNRKTSVNPPVRGTRARPTTSLPRVASLSSVRTSLQATSSRLTTASQAVSMSTATTISRTSVRNTSNHPVTTRLRVPADAAPRVPSSAPPVVTITNTRTTLPATAPRRSERVKSATPKLRKSSEHPLQTPPKSRRRLSSKGDFSPGENIFYCPICLDKVKSSGQIAALMCGHVFCMECITTSLQLKQVCPICSSAQSKPIEIFL